MTIKSHLSTPFRTLAVAAVLAAPALAAPPGLIAVTHVDKIFAAATLEMMQPQEHP